ncbi:MAG: secretin and TonB N-terminal domain-containing protein [Burkholderiaceae bacterium]
MRRVCLRRVWLVLVSTLVCACAEQRVHDQSRSDLAGGRADQAVQVLESGLRENPDSVLLRSDLLQARGQAAAQAVSQAAALRAAGKLDEAQARLERTLATDPANERLIGQLSELSIERRQREASTEAQDLVARGLPEAALRRIAQSLQDNPRHAGLLELQRKLEMAQRQQLLDGAQAVLGETRPISLDFRDANLRSVLDVVSRSSGINFLFDKDVRGDARVSVYLRQAPVQDALDLITGTNGLAMKILDAKTVLIYPNTPDKQRDYEEQIVRLFYLSNADAKGAAAFLRAMLKVREPFVDERTNMVALRDNQHNIQLAERLIATYDSAEPEIVLEMEVIEISSTSLTNLGIQFPTSFSLTPIAPGISAGASGGSGLTLGNVRSLTRDNIALGLGGVTVNLQRQVGDFTTLANPRIRVKNKEKAKVLVGDKIPVVTSTTGTGGFVSDSVSYLDVGLKLDVQPTIYPNDEVSMQVALEVSSLGSSITTSSGTVAYQIGTRDASTVLRLRDGETQLLAGLISKDESSNSNRLPGLGDLPVVGRLFSSTLDNGDRKELVLAITPHIVRNLRQPSASESEFWVGTESAPKLRPAGGLRPVPVVVAPAASGAASAKAINGGDATDAVAAPSATKPPATISLRWEGPHEVHAGDRLDLQLQLSTTIALRGLPVEIRYDPKRLQFVDAEAGKLFSTDGTDSSLSKSDDGVGTARLGVLRNAATGVAGEGPVLTIHFKAIDAGETQVDLAEAKALGLSGPVPAPTLPPGWRVHVE